MVDYVSVLVVVLVTLAIIAAPVAYLVQVNRLLAGTPEEVAKLSPTRWTRELLCDTYDELEEKPITVDTYADRLPPKQQRRYVVTGGSGTSPTRRPGKARVFSLSLAHSLTCLQVSSAAPSFCSCSPAASRPKPSASSTSRSRTARTCSPALSPR